jgi:hypothetical protein
VTSFLEHLSHNICRVIFWNNTGMASASICRINICRITFIHFIVIKYDPCKALQYQFEPDFVYTVRSVYTAFVERTLKDLL